MPAGDLARVRQEQTQDSQGTVEGLLRQKPREVGALILIQELSDREIYLICFMHDTRINIFLPVIQSFSVLIMCFISHIVAKKYFLFLSF